MSSYQNFQHYIHEGWSKEPKEIFKFLNQFIASDNQKPQFNALDVGCATGELISFLSGHYPQANFTGIDVFDDLISQCRQFQPDKQFQNASILQLPNEFHAQFDLITVVGVMSIFDDEELPLFFDNLLKASRPNAVIYILSPFNEYGVDAVIRHRKRMQNKQGDWETGWNVFSKETVVEHIENKCQSFAFYPFKIGFDLQQKEDPIRTWTMKTEFNDRQLMNGLKLLIDHYLLKIIVK